jgi:AcrR family transcriptional regulator
MSSKDETRQRLLEAAGQVFAENGYDGATIRDIVRRAGMNIAAVNYYFDHKHHLYIEAVKSACSCQDETVPLPEWPAGTPAVTKLRDLIHTMLRRIFDAGHPAWHKKLFLREMAEPTAACEELVEGHIRPMAQLLGSILAELVPETPEDRRFLIASSIVGQCMHYRVARPIIELLVGEEKFKRFDAGLLAEHITQFSLAALGLIPSPFAARPAATQSRADKPEAQAKESLAGASGL